MNYYIADTHFGHANIIRMCDRPFADVEEMNQILVNNWNARVRNNDKIYVLGDMFYHCDTDTMINILSELKGQKHLIVGNHDGSWMSKINAEDYFEDISMMTEINDGQRVITLCHYPMLTWRRQKKSYMIYGHIHNDTESDYWPLILKRPHMLNAGVEINCYQPVTFDELVSNNKAFQNINALVSDT